MTTEQISAIGVRPTWTLPDRLRKARELTGLDQAAFAEFSGLARNTVNSYERGHTSPNRIYLELWATKTGVDLTWLRDGDDPTPVTRQSHAPHNSPAVSTERLPIQRLRSVDFIPSQQAA